MYGKKLVNKINEEEIEQFIEDYIQNHVYNKTTSIVSTLLQTKLACVQNLKKMHRIPVERRLTTIVRMGLKKHHSKGTLVIYRNGNPKIYRNKDIA